MGRDIIARHVEAVDALRYCEVLATALVPLIEAKYGEEEDWCVFQQDGASSHKAKYTQDYIKDASITAMSWPATSPDLNPIENLWFFLCREVDAGGRQFDSAEDLPRQLNMRIAVCRRTIFANCS